MIFCFDKQSFCEGTFVIGQIDLFFGLLIFLGKSSCNYFH